MLKRFITLNKHYLVILCILPILGVAKQNDRIAPIKIWADTFIADKNNKRATYTGNVKFEQGSITILCHQLDIVYRQDQSDQIAFITMQANQAAPGTASFEQLSDDDILIKASAENIRYEQKTQLMTFTGDVELQQGSNLFKAESMLFNAAESRLLTNQTDNSNEKNRVFISIQPDKP